MGGLSNVDNTPRRLSKPRTNTSSSNLLSLSEQSNDLASPLNSSASDYFGENVVMLDSQDKRRSRRKSRGKIRAYLYRETVQTSSDDEDERGAFGGAAHDMKKRLSRTGSSIMHIQSAKASTARLSKSESHGSDMEESVLLADRIKEMAYHDSLAAQNHINSSVDEDKHHESILAPLRRKSLYTPGLATRTPNDILRKPPQRDSRESQMDLDYYYDPDKPTNSPLSQIAALSAGEDGRSTPSSLQYSQLGGLQLGTLRVTNGTASPVPSNRAPDVYRRSPIPDSRSHDEFYTASEGSMASEVATPMPQRASSPLRFESKHESSVQRGLNGNRKLSGDFPLTQETPNAAASMAYEYMAELDDSPFSYLEVPLPKEVADERNALHDEGAVVPQVEGPAADVWRHFINDAETRHGTTVTREDAFRRLNGNTPSVPGSQRLSVPSSMASRYSILTETPQIDSGYSSNFSLSANHATLATKNNIEFQSESTSGDFPTEYLCLSGPREMPRRVSILGKYLSHPTGPAPRDFAISKVPQQFLPTPLPSVAALSSSKTVSPVRPSARPTSSNVLRKLQKPRPKSQPPPMAYMAVQRKHSLSQVDIPRVPSLIATQHAERLRQFPVLEHTFPSSYHTSYDEDISPTEPNPIPIRFPSPENALEAVSSGPSNKISKLQEDRRSRSRMPSQHRSSATVDEHQVIPSNIIRSTSWANLGGGRKSKEQKRQAEEDRATERCLTREEKKFEKRLQKDKREYQRQAREEEDTQRSSRSRSASRTRAKSTERRSSHYNNMATIADFGTVTESLGGNPYDIATAIFPSSSLNTSNWHPHQISNAILRPRSMVGMDEAVVAESGRARNRTRSQSFGRPSMPNDDDLVARQSFASGRPCPHAPPMPALAAIDLIAHDLGWAHNRRRSQSFSEARLPNDSSFNDRGGLPGRSIRPGGLVTDAPPVPALPPMQQVQQCGAQTENLHPQSRVVDSSPVLALPNLQTANQEDNEVSISPSPSKGAMARPRKTRTSKLVPDLWSHGSLEKKGSKTIEPPAAIASSSDDVEEPSTQSDNLWEVQRRVWSQRRKSAGEALLRNQKAANLNARDVEPNTAAKDNNRPLAMARAFTAEAQVYTRPEQTASSGPITVAPLPNPLGSNPHVPTQKGFDNTPRPLVRAFNPPAASQEISRPGISPLAPSLVSQQEFKLPSPAQRRAQTQSRSIPRKRVGSGTSTHNAAFERLAGRYTGGLQYGYEAGFGLGGSAGTRGAKTEASRKSIEVSKGFGLDLSDVPIFVAPTLTR